MLFNNYEPFTIPETGVISRESLKKAFPEFYDAENPQPVRVSVLASRLKQRKRVQGSDKIPAGETTTFPAPTGHKAIANIIIDGKSVNLQYSDVMPTIGALSKSFPIGANRIILQNGFTIQPSEEDKLFFIHFGMKVMANGANRAHQPYYEWHRPAEKAKSRIDNWKKDQELKSLVYTKLTKEQVKRAFEGLNLEFVGSDEMNRTFLEDKVRTGGELFVKTFYELIESKSSEPKESVSDTVNALREDEKIKEEGGKFYAKNKLKIGEWNTTPFWDSKKTDSDEAWFALIEHLTVNDALLSKIK